MDKLRILAIVNVAWDARLGAPRVWIELGREWVLAGHTVEKYCLTDAFPTPATSPAIAALRLMWFPFRAAAFVRQNAERFDVVDALVGTLPFSKKSLRFQGLLVARSVGLYRLYDKFERLAVTRWPRKSRGSFLGRIFYGAFYRRGHMASVASLRHCDLVNLPNSDELVCLRDEIRSVKPAIVQPYGVAAADQQNLSAAAGPTESRWRKKKVAFIGMWSVRKGAKDWGAIITQVCAKVPGVRFVFLGTMIEDRKVIEDIGVIAAECVELRSTFHPDELPVLLSDCMVAAFPSYVEGFGLAVVEQLAAAIPTVAYDAPGPRDILGESLAEMLTPAGNVQEFSDALVAILNSDLPTYAKLRSRAAEAALRFSWPRVARATANEYQTRLRDLLQ